MNKLNSRSNIRYIRTLAGVAVLLLAVTMVWLSLGEGEPVPRDKAVKTPSAPETSSPTRTTVTPMLPSSEDLGRPGDPHEAAEMMQQTLEHYKQFAVYPPWSRPADDSQRHLWEWNLPLHDEQPLIVDEQGGALHARVQLDRMFAAAGEPIHATARVWRGNESDVQGDIPFRVHGEVQVWDEELYHRFPALRSAVDAGYIVAGVVEFHESGAPNTRGARFVPAEIARLAEHPRDARFVGWVTYGDYQKPFLVPFRYAPRNPVEVLGLVDEGADNGSLDVAIEIDTRMTGALLVQATLFDADGSTPIAVIDRMYHPPTGRSTITLNFFGRILAESGIDGPYRIGALHGLLLDPAVEQEVFWHSSRTFATASYLASNFSREEWMSPTKEGRIDVYEQMIAELEHGGR